MFGARFLKIIRKVVITTAFFSCSKSEIPSCQHSDQKLRDKLSFPVGVAIGATNIFQNEAYETIVSGQFNAATIENELKMERLMPAKGVYDWAIADQLTDYALSHSFQLHGHPLIWHNQLPFWLSTYEGSTEEWETLFKTYIQTVVKHFKGKVSSWDVVNEAFNEDGTLRNTVWKEHLGSGYIEKAFRYAHEADPDALLFYNDYNLTLNSTKREIVLRYLETLKSAGVPVHGVGFQMHVSTSFPEVSEISTAINEAWRKGFLVRISELDISVNPYSKEMTEPTAKELRSQAERYLEIFQTYREIPAEFQHGITIWGVGDADSWIPYFFNRADYPLLFDHNYLPKPAYCKLIKEL